MPLAVSATTFIGPIDDRSTKLTTWSAKSLSRFRSLAQPAFGGRARAGPSSTRSAVAWMSASPVSTPIGRAPARQSLMPL